MNNTKTILIFFYLLIAGSLLSGCAGGVGIASSWPGLYVDNSSGTAYLALNLHVYAVNLSNGTEKWRFPEKPENKRTFYAPPTLSSDGRLILGSYNHILYSINPQNGQQMWEFTEASDKYISSVLCIDENIYAPNTNNFLYAINSNGALRWKFEAKHALWTKPLTDGTNIFVASMDHYVYALDAATGKQVWKSQDMGGAIVGSLAYDPAGILYVGVLGGVFSAVDARNGQTLWQMKTGGWIWGKPVFQDGVLFLGNQDGKVYAIDSKTGAVRWQIQPDQTENRAILSTPVIADGSLYFASQAGILYAVKPENGNPIWNKTIGGKIYSDLALADDMILIAPVEYESALIAVDLQGNTRWTFAPSK